MNNQWAMIILVVVLLLMSAFFSSSETALFALDEMKIKQLKNKKSRRRIRIMLGSSSLLLITILFGNTAVNTAVTTVMESLLSIQNPIISTIVVACILLLVAEITPKTVALMRTEQISVLNSRLLYPFFLILKPAIRLLDKLVNLIPEAIERMRGNENTDVDTDHLSALLSIVTREGIFDPDEQKLIEGVIGFAGREVWNIMTPRIKVTSIDKNTSVRDIVKLLKKVKFSKIPVYEGTDDNILGVVTIRDLIPFAHNPDKTTEKKAGDIMEPMYFVPETKKLSEMLEDFKIKKIRIAAVVDEYGGCLGIVTIADVLGEIVGELMDESFKLENSIIRISKKRFLVRGDVSLDDFNSYFKTDLSSNEYETLAGYFIQTAGDIPGPEFFLQIDKLKIQIRQKSEKHIEQFIVEEV